MLYCGSIWKYLPVNYTYLVNAVSCCIVCMYVWLYIYSFCSSQAENCVLSVKKPKKKMLVAVWLMAGWVKERPLCVALQVVIVKSYLAQHYASVHFCITELKCLLSNLSCSVCLPWKISPYLWICKWLCFANTAGRILTSDLCNLPADALQKFESTFSCSDQNNL